MMIDMKNEINLNELFIFLEEVGINFFSSTTFDSNQNPVYSICNNAEWFSFYKDNYFPESSQSRSSLPEPPVKDVILRKKKGVIWWDRDLFGGEVTKYIIKRNDVCSTKLIGTFLASSTESQVALSLGSKYDQNHIIRVIKNHNKLIEDLIAQLLIVREPNKIR